jgi:hypothetical protein
MKTKLATSAILSLAVLVFAGCAAPPPPPRAAHPAYLHALTDLRDARWNLEHRPADPAVSDQEGVAIAEIDSAIVDLRRAAADDGKNLADRPHEDARLDHRGRLHHAVELLRKAHADISREEDNPAAREQRNRALGHINAAIGATDRAIVYAEQGR